MNTALRERLTQFHLDLFEARYGDQIHRFYADLCGDCLIELDSTASGADPPF